MGMTNEQYKGMLLQWMQDLKDVQELVENKADEEKLSEAVQKKINLVDQMLKV